MLKPSEFNRKITFYTPVEPILNESGTMLPQYEPFVTLWCAREDLLRENLEKGAGGGVVTRKRTKLNMRYRNDIEETMIFKIDGITYNVIAVGSDDGRFKETVVYGESVEDGGF